MSQLTIINNSLNATAYLWDFGDGDTSTDTNPVHNYSASGIYVVRLTATGAGGSAVAEQPVSIQASSTIHFLATSYLDQLTDDAGNLLTVGS